MDLQLNDELLSAFLDGEVSQEERVQIEAQLASSPEWRRRYHQLIETVNAVRTLPEVAMPRDFSQDIMAQIAQRQQELQSQGEVGSVATVSVATSTDRSVASRRRQRQSPYSSAWIAVAVCLLIAAGLGIAYQAGLFGSGGDQMIAQREPSNIPEGKPANNSVTHDNEPGVGKLPEETSGSPFPTVDELANSQNNLPEESIPVNEPKMERNPFGIRVNVRTKPGKNTEPGSREM